MSSPSVRPRQVTAAAWLIMGGSFLVVVTVFDRMAGLHSLETREAVQQVLAEPPADGLGIGVPAVLEALRVLLMVTAGCATAAGILGYQVLQRSRSARLALTVLAVPLFVAGLAADGFLSSLVAASAVMLWLQPARDWFRDAPSSLGSSSTQGFDGKAPAQPAARESAPPPPQQRPAPAPRPELLPRLATDPTVRPPAVVWACVLTWVFAGLALLVMAGSIAVLATSPGVVFDELHRQNPDLAAQGVSDETLRVMTFIVGGVIVVWSVAAILAAVLAFRRVDWARLALVVSSAGSAALCLLATVGEVVIFVPLVASVVTLALLVRPDVRAWYDAGRRVTPGDRRP